MRSEGRIVHLLFPNSLLSCNTFDTTPAIIYGTGAEEGLDLKSEAFRWPAPREEEDNNQFRILCRKTYLRSHLRHFDTFLRRPQRDRHVDGLFHFDQLIDHLRYWRIDDLLGGIRMSRPWPMVSGSLGFPKHPIFCWSTATCV